MNQDDVTPKQIYLDRRRFIKTSAFLAAAPFVGIAGNKAKAQLDTAPSEHNNESLKRAPQWLVDQVRNAKKSTSLRSEHPSYHAIDKPTPRLEASTYNNFYEFGNSKTDPAENANSYNPYPYTLKVEGEVRNPGEYSLEDLVKPQKLQERLYRLRCVEAWSMVIPWVGFSLHHLIDIFQPTPNARFIAFETAVDRVQMSGTRSFFSTIDWPYQEGLRLDEAMHPLTLVAVGMYGKVLPGQNGPPLRLVIPWKYGFKSIKSVVTMRFTRSQPKTSWQSLQPSEYGFYANVNPSVQHPRWSQKRERRLPSSSFFRPNWITTLPFNGYEDEVKELYKGMDLSLFY